MNTSKASKLKLSCEQQISSDDEETAEPQVLTLLALLVQILTPRARIQPQVLSLPAILVQKYKY